MPPNPGVSVQDEVSPLSQVILGIADSPGPPRGINAKSKDAIAKGLYPTEAQLVPEMDAFADLLTTSGVQVLRPRNVPDLNQIFARDIGFVVGDTFVRAAMKEPIRALEYYGIEHHIRTIANAIVTPPAGVTVEGGDVFLYGDAIILGVGRRTNQAAISWLRDLFPSRSVLPFELVHNTPDPRLSVLHLDCIFQPLGKGRALIYPAGFTTPPDELFQLFATADRIELQDHDLYDLRCNIVSIDQDHLVSCDTFSPLNSRLTSLGYKVSAIPYSNVSILGGLLRCSTLPLRRGP